MPYPGGATFDFPDQGVGGGRKWEDLGALRIKEVRVTRRARSTPQYIIACQGADVKGTGARARGSRSEQEQRRYARHARGADGEVG